jgi:hypothetical protein
VLGAGKQQLQQSCSWQTSASRRRWSAWLRLLGRSGWRLLSSLQHGPPRRSWSWLLLLKRR